MIRITAIIFLLAFASPAVVADGHKSGKEKADKEMRKEAKQHDKEARKAEKEAREKMDRDDSDDSDVSDDSDDSEGGGREKAMSERNQENSRREEAVQKTKARPWWRFWGD